MTYGEAYTRVKLSLHMVDGEFVSIKIPQHDEQMCKEDAAKYYTKKMRKEFERLGYEYKERVKVETIEDFKIRIGIAFKRVRRQTNNMIRAEVKKNIELLRMAA